MCRSAFFKTLATLLAGAHTAAPLGIPGLPTDARCKAPAREPRACGATAAAATVACR